MKVRAAQLLVNSVLPEELRDYNRPLDSKGLNAPLLQLAQTKSPEEFVDIIQKLADIGRKASYLQGETLRLNDFRGVLDKKAVFAKMDAEVEAARAQFKNDPEGFKEERRRIWQQYSDDLQKVTMREALRQGNNLGYSVVSGARGKPAQIQALLTTPGLYADQNDRTIPLFVRHSFGEGLRPGEYLAGAYGARKAVISTKRCLAAGTMVRMADGTQQAIETIRPGDRVMGADRYGRLAPVVVTRFYDQGVQNCWEWSLRVGYGPSQRVITLRATDEHRILSTSLRRYSSLGVARHRGAIVADEALRNAYHEIKITPIGAGESKQAAVLPTQAAVFDTPGVREDYALILGLLAGDGCLTLSKQGKGVRLYLSVADDSLKSDLEPYLVSRGLELKPRSGLNYDHEIVAGAYDRSAHAQARVVKGVQGFAHQARHPVKQAVLRSGMYGKYAHEKVLPARLMDWDQHSIESYLAGLFSADGCFHTTSSGTTVFRLFLTSETLIHQVSELLLWRYGIAQAAFIQRIDTQTVDGITSPRKHPLFGFGFGGLCELRKLASVFALMLGGKGQKARAALAKIEKQSNPYTKAYISRGSHLGMTPCYDIEVANSDHLFMLASGVIVSNSTALGGALGKMMVQATAPLIVTEDDCGVENGIDFDVNSKWARHRVLARPAGKLPAGTILDREALKQLRSDPKIESVVVRSTMTCQAPNGICAKCAGADPKGHLYALGEQVGVTSSNAMEEPLAQGALNVKHQSGQASGQREYSGFDVINRFVSSPEAFEDRAVVAEEDGRITGVEPAPQGGTFVTLNNQTKHYVFPGYPVTVKVGDKVEAGDQLAEGLVDPEDVVRLRGLGEGRLYYAQRLKQIMDDSGHTTDPRNVEPLARAALDHVRIPDAEDYDEGTMPDDLISYSAFRRGYRPPDDTEETDPDSAVGRYLQKDALHYTIGTRITPSIAGRLRKAQFGKIAVSDQKPDFQNEVVRIMAASHNQRDWLASQYSTYLKRQLAEGAMRGDDTLISGSTHFAPSLAVGEGFGKHVREKGHF